MKPRLLPDVPAVVLDVHPFDSTSAPTQTPGDPSVMSWRKNLTDVFTDVLRLAARAGLLINAIILSCFSVWFVYRGCRKLAAFLDNWLFQ